MIHVNSPIYSVHLTNLVHSRILRAYSVVRLSSTVFNSTPLASIVNTIDAASFLAATRHVCHWPQVPAENESRYCYKTTSKS
jgi:hypothetical protein